VFLIAGISGTDLWQASTRGYFQGPGSPTFVAASTGVAYTDEQQSAIVYEAHAAYFFNLVACQAVNIFICKTRVVSVFAHGPLANPITACES
jgi:hypothetical protein